MRSSLEVFELATRRTRVVLQTDRHIEAPNWDTRRRALLVNSEGQLYRVELAGGDMALVPTEGLEHLNNDHGLSPDGRLLAVSDNVSGRGSIIYTLGSEGGAVSRVTEEPGAYWHGWSPDGETLAFCGLRNHQFDIYTMPVVGGSETQLTGRDGVEGHNDGPDYSPDGKWIWFNSDRSGHAQLWKMRADGSDVTRMTEDDRVNWFPHPSPDGAWVVYLSYPPGTERHPPDLDVQLRLMRPDGTETHEILAFNGGQGTINVPSWAQDGSAFAYVGYAKP